MLMRGQFVYFENMGKMRVEFRWMGEPRVSKQPLRHPPKSDAVIIPANIPDGLFHLLRADPNVVLSLKTEATTPHYRLSVRLYLSLSSGSVSPSRSTTRDFASTGRGLAHANLLYPRSFPSTPFPYPPFFIPLDRPRANYDPHSTPAGHNTRYP